MLLISIYTDTVYNIPLCLIYSVLQFSTYPNHSILPS